MDNSLNKEKYYQKYTLVEFEPRRGTIEFKENGICEIDLSEFSNEVPTGNYCEKNHRFLIRTTYNKGNCTYEIKENNIFKIKYDGTYSKGQYCETHEFKETMRAKNVVSQTLGSSIIIQFDNNYESFNYLNGLWKEETNWTTIVYSSK